MRLAAIAVVVAAAAPAQADDVYLGVGDRGLVRFDGTRTRTVTAKPKFVTAIVPGAAGALWLGSTLFTYRWNGTALDEKLLSVPYFVRARAGVPWIGNQKDVSWFDGGWHTLLVPDPRVGIEDLEVDDQGRVWVLHRGKLSYTTGRAWTGFATPPEIDDVKHCRLAARGDLFVACWEHVFRLHANRWTVVGALPRVAITDLHVGGDGTIYIAAFHQGENYVYMLPPDGSEAVRIATPHRYQLRAFTVDDRGRIWLGSDDGLAVYARDGKRVRLPRGLRTRDAVRAIYVVGRGPDF